MAHLQTLLIALLGLSISLASSGCGRVQYDDQACGCETESGLTMENYTPTPTPLTGDVSLPQDAIDQLVVSTVRTALEPMADGIAFERTVPVLLEITASGSIDFGALYPWARKVFVEVVGGGGAGGNGNGTTTAGGGGGSGRKVSGWLALDYDVDSTITIEIGSGGNPAGTGIGGLSRVRYGTPQHALVALGGLPGTLANGGNGYSGGGSAGGAGGNLGSNGASEDGTGGEGLRDLLGSGDGIEIAAAPGEGGLAGGGGGAAGHWGSLTADGGGGVGGAGGGAGGTGIGAGGGGGGGGLSGDGGTGLRGGVRIWIY